MRKSHTRGQFERRESRCVSDCESYNTDACCATFRDRSVRFVYGCLSRVTSTGVQTSHVGWSTCFWVAALRWPIELRLLMSLSTNWETVHSERRAKYSFFFVSLALRRVVCSRHLCFALFRSCSCIIVYGARLCVAYRVNNVYIH